MINKLVLTWILCLGCCFANIVKTGTCTNGSGNSTCTYTCVDYCSSLSTDQFSFGVETCVNGQCVCNCETIEYEDYQKRIK